MHYKGDGFMFKSIKSATPKQILFGVLLAFIFFISVCVITGFLISDFQAYAEITENEDFAQECNKSLTAGYENVDENTNQNNNNYLNSSGQTYEDYIKANVDTSYSKNNKFTSGTLMILKQTLADSNKLGSINSMDSLHYGDNPDAELAMYDNYCVL